MADANDPRISKWLRSKTKQDARSWLHEGRGHHNVGELSPADSANLVEHLYQLGATEVWAVELSTNAGYSSTDHLIVGLPPKKSQRSAIFEWENERASKMGFEDPQNDNGQSHILIWFD